MMPKVSDILEICKEIAPPILCEEYDNAGLLVGDVHQEVGGILLALDLRKDVIQEAVEKGANLLITHHPVLFSPTQRLVEDGGEISNIRRLIQCGISHIAMHTNLDAVDDGICDVLCRRLGIENPQRLTNASDEALIELGVPMGYGRIGTVKEQPLAQFARMVRDALEAECVQYAGEGDKIIQRVAVASGSGASVAEEAYRKGADCLVTGEIRHHLALEYVQRGMAMVDAGHYDTEKVILPILQERLQSALFALNYNVHVLLTKTETGIFTQVG